MKTELPKELVDVLLNSLGTNTIILNQDMEVVYTNIDKNLMPNFLKSNSSDDNICYVNDKIYDRNGQKVNLFGQDYTMVNFKDVTEMLREISSLKKEVSEDPKTGILTSKAFVNEVANLAKTKEPFVLGMIDVDNFKLTNDQYGHQVGDEVLINVAQSFAQEFKNNIKKTDIIGQSAVTKNPDLVGRYGGDEFIFALKSTDVNSVKKRVEAIADKLREGIVSNGQVVKTTLSVGITQYDYTKSYEENVASADKAVYISKENGRNQVNVSKQETEDLEINEPRKR